MKRYETSRVDKRWDGKRVYKTTYYPVIPQQESDAIIISNEGDYLDALAYKYYGDPSLWFIIALCNNIGKGRMSVPAGMQIRVPSNINSIIIQFNSMDR